MIVNRLMFVLLLTVAIGCDDRRREISKPNIIFILADDLGYGDLGVYGQEKIKTPEIDKMAQDGLMFTQFYSGSAVCSPARCVLLTGKHTGHAYLRANTRQPIPLEEVTIAEILKESGYKTAMFGKWSLGLNGSSGDPAYQGFEEFLGYNNQGDAHFYYVDSLDKIVGGKSIRIPVDSTRYTHDMFVDNALSFISKNQDNPFFLYLPVCIPHAELTVPDEDLALYLEDGESVFDEEPYKGNHYCDQEQPRATYAAMVSKLDKDVGKIINLLEKLELNDNTYVFFTSDNGPHQAGGHNYRYFNGNANLRGAKGTLYEGGIRVPMIAWAPGKIEPGTVSDQPWAFWDILPTLGEIASTRIPEAIDGLSFMNTLHGMEPVAQHKYFYWEYKGNTKEGPKYIQAIRDQDFKLVKKREGNEMVVTELYNLSNDEEESLNLINEFTEIANSLDQEAQRLTVKPENQEFYNFSNF